MKRIVLAVTALALCTLAAAEPFTLNSSTWQLMQAFEEKMDATPIDDCPIEGAQAACFEWNAFLPTARSTLDQFMLEGSPGRQFTEASGEWAQVSEREITRTYLRYGKPLIVYFNGSLLVFMTD